MFCKPFSATLYYSSGVRIKHARALFSEQRRASFRATFFTQPRLYQSPRYCNTYEHVQAQILVPKKFLLNCHPEWEVDPARDEVEVSEDGDAGGRRLEVVVQPLLLLDVVHGSEGLEGRRLLRLL